MNLLKGQGRLRERFGRNYNHVTKLINLQKHRRPIP